MSITAMFAYNQHSEGSKELARALSVPRIKHHGSNFRGKPDKTIINWGAGLQKVRESAPETLLNCRVLNHPERVDVASDKLQAFRAFQAAGVPIPEFTTDIAEAHRWLEADETVMARTVLRGHSGRGIVIMDPEQGDTWDVRANLYVKYKKKKDEYRVHVLRNQVIDVQRKGLREEFRGQEDVNWMVRNLANGFVFVRNDGRTPPQSVLDAGVAAVNALGLDFGAADVIYNERESQAFVLEVNTAPGLVGTTVTNYANAFGRI